MDLPTASGQFSGRCFVPNDEPMGEGDRGGVVAGDAVRSAVWQDHLGEWEEGLLTPLMPRSPKVIFVLV
jgi:hypothetical protein